jgi:hypothetical protein
MRKWYKGASIPACDELFAEKTRDLVSSVLCTMTVRNSAPLFINDYKWTINNLISYNKGLPALASNPLDGVPILMVSARIAAAIPLRTRMAAASAPRACRKRISDKQGGQQSFHRTKDSPLIEQQPPSLLVFSAAREILSTRVEYTIHMQKVCVKESSRMPATFFKKEGHRFKYICQ